MTVHNGRESIGEPIGEPIEIPAPTPAPTPIPQRRDMTDLIDPRDAALAQLLEETQA